MGEERIEEYLDKLTQISLDLNRAQAKAIALGVEFALEMPGEAGTAFQDMRESIDRAIAARRSAHSAAERALEHE